MSISEPELAPAAEPAVEGESSASETVRYPKPKYAVLRSTALWLGAVFLAASAMIYQRATGPTYPFKGTVTVDETPVSYSLHRTQETTREAVIVFPNEDPQVSKTLVWRRYPTDDEFERVTMTPPTDADRKADLKVNGGDERIADWEEQEIPVVIARLPKQKSAGKVEYTIEVQPQTGSTIRIPERDATETGTVLLRYKDPVPDGILIPHVVCMILTILLGMRAGLSALFDPRSFRLYAWLALGCMTFGGMMLGPIVQKYAFGEYWTGFPLGGDWTDNKMLVMWGAWLLACTMIGFSPQKREWPARSLVLAASIVMTITYLIPHSMGGSQRDYESDSIRTGLQASLSDAAPSTIAEDRS